MDPLLQIENLSVDFITESGITAAVRDISFDIYRGEITAIVGESGSGKSVTALAVMQLLKAPPAVYRSGNISFRSKETTKVNLLSLTQKELNHYRGKEIAMIFQEPMTSLNPVLSCGRQVMEAILAHQKSSYNEAKHKTIELFERVKLPSPAMVFSRYPHQLSGGQKQRVMIAMAMSCKPSLLIADEPTTALDVTVQKTILELIKELQSEFNIGVIFISHDLGVVSGLADKVLVMYKGKIVEQARAAAIFNSPKHPYTKALIACRPQNHRKGDNLPVVSDFMEITGDLPVKKTTFGNEGGDTRNEPATKERHKELLTVKNLSVWFPGRKTFTGRPKTFIRAVDDISFEVYKGETLGLVGESGCGKTTLGRTLLRLIEPTKGEIFFEGKDLLKISSSELRKLRKDIQIIFQDPYSSLNPRITIGNAISEVLKMHEPGQKEWNRKERVIDLLEKVDLKADHFHRYPHEFSGGQRQRICIARALILNPSFIVCDESVSALDVSVQAQVLNLLNNLQKEYGFTSVFISHDLSVVKFISDRIMVMNRGKIEETGTAEEIYNHPRMEYTRRLIDSIPVPHFSL